MKAPLRRDLERLKQLAFRRTEHCGVLLKRIHRLPVEARSHPAGGSLDLVRQWLLTPFTLWPIDFVGLGNHLLTIIKTGKGLDADTSLLLSLIAEHPLPREQTAIAAHEHQVRAGSYESLITAQPKFTHTEQLLFENPAFQSDWENLKARFDVEMHRDRKGVIRRRMTHERSFHPEGWEFNWRTRDDRFRVVFDAFCHRWILYGMEGDRPLLQKLSVNITPFGTMIFIPRYWSFDWRRDLKWGAINGLHRSRDVRRQGAKLGQNQRERMQEAKRVSALWLESKRSGLKGDACYATVIEKMGWHPKTDFSRVRRLLKLVEPKRNRKLAIERTHRERR